MLPFRLKKQTKQTSKNVADTTFNIPKHEDPSVNLENISDLLEKIREKKNIPVF